LRGRNVLIKPAPLKVSNQGKSIGPYKFKINVEGLSSRSSLGRWKSRIRRSDESGGEKEKKELEWRARKRLAIQEIGPTGILGEGFPGIRKFYGFSNPGGGLGSACRKRDITK